MRVAANVVMGLIMNRGEAIGCEVTISGKLRGQRAKSQKYKQGYIVSSGQPKLEYVDEAVRDCELRQGIIGIKVKIMARHDPSGKSGPSKPLPDVVTIAEPKGNEYENYEPGAIQVPGGEPSSVGDQSNQPSNIQTPQ